LKHWQLALFWAVLGIAVLGGCASTGFLMASPKVTMFMQAGTPRPDDFQIQVFYSNRPSAEYQEMAMIEVGDTDDNYCMKKITEKARDMGADAVIILGEVGSYGLATGSATARNGYATATGMGATQEYGISALAIRFITKEQ